MSGKDLKRLRVIREYIEKRISRSEAAEKLKLSEKQITRMKKKIVIGNDQNIVHGLIGKPSNNKSLDDIKKLVLDIYKSKYEPCGFNFSHLTEKLIEV